MDDSRVVGRHQRIGNLPRDAERIGDRQRPTSQAVLQRGTLDQLEHQTAYRAVFRDAINRRDVRVVE